MKSRLVKCRMPFFSHNSVRLPTTKHLEGHAYAFALPNYAQAYRSLKIFIHQKMVETIMSFKKQYK